MTAQLTRPLTEITFTSDQNLVDITVTGSIRFQEVDLALMKLGLTYSLRCAMFGDDSPNSDVPNGPDERDPTLAVTFDPPVIRLRDVQPASVDYTFTAKNVPKARLNEDPKPGDIDEVFARVSVTSNIPAVAQSAASAIIKADFAPALVTTAA